MIYDAIILGLGGIGSAIADRLARSGQKVLGLEQFTPVHDKGSSHGETRAIRKAYFEHESYVPLLKRAYELWDKVDENILVKSGCVMMGSESSRVIKGCLNSARQHNLTHEMLDPNQLEKRFGFRVPKESVGFYEPDGGYLLVERCIELFQTQAQSAGADLRFQTHVAGWTKKNDEVEVVTLDEKFRAKNLVIALGAWLPKFHVTPRRTVQYWFDSPTEPRHPVFFQETPSGQWLYGFPKVGAMMKIAFHNVHADCDPDQVARSVGVDEVQNIAVPAKNLMPNLGAFAKAKTCIYEMTPDEHFLLGGIDKNIFVAGGFSGHGFKFAPVIGEIAEDFILGKPRHDIKLFDPRRFIASKS